MRLETAEAFDRIANEGDDAREYVVVTPRFELAADTFHRVMDTPDLTDDTRFKHLVVAMRVAIDAVKVENLRGRRKSNKPLRTFVEVHGGLQHWIRPDRSELIMDMIRLCTRRSMETDVDGASDPYKSALYDYLVILVFKMLDYNMVTHFKGDKAVDEFLRQNAVRRETMSNTRDPTDDLNSLIDSLRLE